MYIYISSHSNASNVGALRPRPKTQCAPSLFCHTMAKSINPESELPVCYDLANANSSYKNCDFVFCYTYYLFLMTLNNIRQPLM